MKKLTTLMFLTGFLAFSYATVNAQDDASQAADSTDAVFEEAAAEEAPAEETAAAADRS